MTTLHKIFVTKLPTQIFSHMDSFRLFGAKMYIMVLPFPFVANTLQFTFMHIYIYTYTQIYVCMYKYICVYI